jgi:hypothetical protein
MSEVLDGGCILIEFPRKPAEPPKARQPKKRHPKPDRRPMTPMERTLAFAFANCPPLRSSRFAMAMFNHAIKGWGITERQGEAIYEVARHHHGDLAFLIGFAPLDASTKKEG